MSALILQESKNTPEIVMDSDNGTYIIKGKCFPENSKKFFTPVVEWLTLASVKQKVTLEITLDYISSSSVIAILELIRHIEKLAAERNFTAEVIWNYEEGDDDMFNVALNYQKLCQLPIEIKEYL